MAGEWREMALGDVIDEGARLDGHFRPRGARGCESSLQQRRPRRIDVSPRRHPNHYITPSERLFVHP